MNSREDFNDYVNTILNATNFRDGIKHDAKEKLLKYINSHAAEQRDACEKNLAKTVLPSLIPSWMSNAVINARVEKSDENK